MCLKHLYHTNKKVGGHYCMVFAGDMVAAFPSPINILFAPTTFCHVDVFFYKRTLDRRLSDGRVSSSSSRPPPASLHCFIVVSLLLCPRAFAGGGSLILYHTLPVSFVTTSFSSEKEPHARQAAAAAAAEGDPKQTQEGGSILRLSIRIYHTPVSFYQEIQQPSYNHVRLYSLQVPLRDDV